MRALVAILAVLGCQGGSSDSSESPPPPVKHGSDVANSGFGKHDAAEPTPPPPATDDAHVAEEPEPADPGKAIAELGAVPAWQAVVDRAQYLMRRGQHGVAYGVIGAPILMPPAGGDGGLVPSPYTWLIDDSEGNGSLGIRAALGAKGEKLKAGDRVALGGAWALDDDHKWYWRVDAVSALPPAPPSKFKDPQGQPGHVIANGDLPAGTKPISKAGDDDWVYFSLVGMPPAIDGDGWPVADQLGDPIVALLNLPGEHASYGAQDMRTADERWHLKRGSVYVVRVGIVHHHGPDKPATMMARTAPVKVM